MVRKVKESNGERSDSMGIPVDEVLWYPTYINVWIKMDLAMQMAVNKI